eukprot:Skav217813  [mRNA]  locus=scaffold889:84557:88259:+ [translate_table: standard]
MVPGLVACEEKEDRSESGQEPAPVAPSATASSSVTPKPAETSPLKSKIAPESQRKKKKKERKRSSSKKRARKDPSTSPESRTRSTKKRKAESSCVEGASPLRGEKLRKEKAEPLRTPPREPRPVFRGDRPYTPPKSPPPAPRSSGVSAAADPSTLGLSAAPKAPPVPSPERPPLVRTYRRDRAGHQGQAPRRSRWRPAAEKEEEEEERIVLREVGVRELLSLGLAHVKGRYWDAPVEVVGVPKGFREEGEDHFIRFEARGTKQENLLRYLSSLTTKEILLHPCEDPCTRLLWRDGLVHVDKVTKVEGEQADWMSNAMAVLAPLEGAADPEDELRALREEQQRVAPGRGAERAEEKNKRRRKDAPIDLEGEETAPKASSSRPMKIAAKKDVKLVFGSTGLDPDPIVRKRFRNKARKMNKKRKKKKQKKGDSYSGSSSKGSRDSRSSEESQEEGAQPAELFGETSLVRKIGNKYPGVLTASWLRESQDHLMTSQGQLWSHVEGPVPPLGVQYFRQAVAPRMTGAMGREYQSLAYMLDLSVQGRVAEACDVMVQRMKSLSSTQSGIHYSISQRLELLPVDRAIPASLQETQAAARAAEMEDRVMHRASRVYRPWGSNAPQDPGRGGKGKEGKGKKGKTKKGEKSEEGKGSQGEGKK